MYQDIFYLFTKYIFNILKTLLVRSNKCAHKMDIYFDFKSRHIQLYKNIYRYL